MESSDVKPSLGISVSDFVPARGHISADVYARVDHLEYGGLGPPRSDPGWKRIARDHATRPMGLHLVGTELASNLDVRHEADRIMKALAPFSPRYLLTDAELWTLGDGHLWPRPVSLRPAVVEQIAASVTGLRNHLGLPVLVENPALIAVDGELTVPEFMRDLASAGVEICLDIGHFHAAVRNTRADPEECWEALPKHAVRVAHIAGLSSVQHLGREFLIDNHDVQPLGACFDLLGDLISEASSLGWITYEAELAPADVQRQGLDRLRSVVDRCAEQPKKERTR